MWSSRTESGAAVFLRASLAPALLALAVLAAGCARTGPGGVQPAEAPGPAGASVGQDLPAGEIQELERLSGLERLAPLAELEDPGLDPEEEKARLLAGLPLEPGLPGDPGDAGEPGPGLGQDPLPPDRTFQSPGRTMRAMIGGPSSEGRVPSSPSLSGLSGRGFVPVSEHEGLAEVMGLSPSGQGLRSWKDLEIPLRRSLAHVSRQPRTGLAVVRPDLRLTWGQMERSLALLLSLLPRLDAEPGLLARHFVWYRYQPGVTMTAYYAPVVEASLTPRAGFQIPLYARPPDLVRLDLGRFSGRMKNQWLVARTEGGRVSPFYSRRDIDGDQALSGRGLELAWLKDPLDAFYLHVQGSGKLKLPDGSLRTVGYAGDNGRPFTGLASILLREGRLGPERVNMDAVREYFAAHPQELRPAMFKNERYIFFRFLDQEPSGNMGKPLTPLLSMATDPSLLPPGSVFAVRGGTPGAGGRTVSGIGLAQDAGVAIKGRRLDCYVGEGREAGRVAQNIKTPTAVHLLVSREALLQ